MFNVYIRIAMKNIWITGGSRGIGLETVKAFLADHFTVVVLTRNCNALAGLQEQYPKTLICKSIDLINIRKDDLPKLQVDALINNAGALVNKSFESITSEDLHRVYRTNVFGPIHLIQMLMPQFSKGIHVVNISSIGGVTGSVKFAGLSAYSSSKGALSILTECLQAEYGESTNWTFNCLALGAVQTEMLEEAFPGYQAPVHPEQMAEYIKHFTLNNQKVMRGRVVEVSLSTP